MDKEEPLWAPLYQARDQVVVLVERIKVKKEMEDEQTEDEKYQAAILAVLSGSGINAMARKYALPQPTLSLAVRFWRLRDQYISRYIAPAASPVPAIAMPEPRREAKPSPSRIITEVREEWDWRKIGIAIGIVVFLVSILLTAVIR